MSNGRRNSGMLITTVIFGLVAGALLCIEYYKGGGQHISGLRSAFSMTIEILPLLVFALIIAGMIQTLLSQEIVEKWVGAESGMRGILIGSVAGGLCPGGPFVSLPVAAGLFRSGASIGTMVAFITGWSTWAVIRLPMEVGILGWKLTLIRIVSTVLFPPMAGIIAQILFGGSK